MVPKYHKYPFAFCTLGCGYTLYTLARELISCPNLPPFPSLLFLPFFSVYVVYATTHTLLHAALCQSDMFMMRGECGWNEGNISMLDSVDSDHMLIFLFSLKETPFKIWGER